MLQEVAQRYGVQLLSVSQVEIAPPREVLLRSIPHLLQRSAPGEPLPDTQHNIERRVWVQRDLYQNSGLYLLTLDQMLPARPARPALSVRQVYCAGHRWV